MRGVTYCQGATPIVGRAVGECVKIECARMAINGTKFQVRFPIKSLQSRLNLKGSIMRQYPYSDPKERSPIH